MGDLTVENMFSGAETHIRKLIPGMALGALDRKRIIEHVIADVTSEILNAPGTNPVGLTITTSMVQINGEACLEVVASTPQYDLSEDFFTR